MESKPVDELLDLIAQAQAAEQQARDLRRQAQEMIPVARVAFDITQTALAREAGIPQAYLSQVENVASSASTDSLLNIVNAIPVVAEGGNHGDQRKRKRGRDEARKARGE
jgi:hypothetical protein